MVATTIAQPSPSSEPITLHLIGRTSGYAAFIFSHSDAFRCRTTHRILGDFVGTLPKHTAQNQYLSLPLALSYEEAVFGISHGFFRLLDAHPSSLPAPQSAAVTRFWDERKKEEERQADEALRHQEEERKRRNNKGLKRPRHDLDNETPDSTSPSAVGATNEEPPRKAARISFFRRAMYGFRSALYAIVPAVGPPAPLPALPAAEPATDPSQEEQQARANEQSRKDALKARLKQQARATTLVVTSTDARPDELSSYIAQEVKLPQPVGVPPERLADRVAVFADLHGKGYYLSCGAKFGADFLAYAGDPQLFHAALAVVVAASDEEISPLDVVALGRLGDSTKKRTVLAFRDEGAVQYIGVQWEETLP